MGMNSRTICHLIPKSHAAMQAVQAEENKAFVSRCSDTTEDGPADYGLEIGYHVRAIPSPGVIAEIGRNADLIWPASSISRVQISLEINPYTKAIICRDQGRLPTTIGPDGFKEDAGVRCMVLTPGTAYTIKAGAGEDQLYEFKLVWTTKDGEHVKYEIQKESYLAQKHQLQNPRLALTVAERVTDIQTWSSTGRRAPAGQVANIEEYLSSIKPHAPVAGVVTWATGPTCKLGEGGFGQVSRVVDIYTRLYVAAKVSL